MRNSNIPFTTTIQRDKYFKMKFEEGNYDLSDRGAMSFQVKMESEISGISDYVKGLDGEKGRDIHDIVMDLYQIKYE